MWQISDLFEVLTPNRRDALKYVSMERIQGAMRDALSANDSARAVIGKIHTAGDVVIQVAFIRKSTDEPRHELPRARATLLRDAVRSGVMSIVPGDFTIRVSRWLRIPDGTFQVSEKRYEF